MSDKQWYEGLSGDELEGKHVHVVFKRGTVVDGRLGWDGSMYVSHTRQVAVLGPGKGGSWEPSLSVESVSLVWDERDWEQILTEDISKADAVVVNGHLLAVTRAVRDVFLVEGFNPVPASFVSCALRRRSKLPTEPGFYQGSDGTLLIRLKSNLIDSWMYVSRDFAESGAFVTGEQAEQYLPLTPVHFVDGRAGK